MNVNENFQYQRKIVPKILGRTYKITCISDANCHRVLAMVLNKYQCNLIKACSVKFNLFNFVFININETCRCCLKMTDKMALSTKKMT